MRKKIIAILVILMVLLSAQTVFATPSAISVATPVTPNPNVTIVNPVSGSTIYSDNLLVSVKVTGPLSIKVSVTQEFKVEDGVNISVSLEENEKLEKAQTANVTIGTTDAFTSTNNLSFHTKKVENVKPGVYKITVDTVDAEGDVLYTNSNLVEIKAKEENPANAAVVESQSSGTAQFLKNLLRAIFRD